MARPLAIHRPFKVVPKERRTYNHVTYASATEARRAKELDDLVRLGQVLWWIGQPQFRLGCAENMYRPDFLVVVDTGLVHAEDVKCAETRELRRWVKLWRNHGPCLLQIMKPKGKSWLRENIYPPERMNDAAIYDRQIT